MLGKLFKSKSLQNVAPLPDHMTAQDSHKPNNCFEDSYTREILYGNSDFSLEPVTFNPSRFRLIVSQDGGNLRSKQVLFDSAMDTSPSRDAASGRTTPVPESSSGLSGTPRIPPPQPMNTPAKLLHNSNELNDFMFGRGLPSNERTTATKIHLLPHFNSFRGVLISNLFSISDTAACHAENDTVDVYWNPQPVLPTREALLDTTCKSPGSFDLHTKSGFNSRFSIGVIIPLEDPSQSVEEVVAPYWTAIAHHLIVLQKLVTRKLISALKAATVHNYCPYINNRRISLPKGFLQMESELSMSLQKLIKLVSNNVNSPRICNINSVLAYALNTQDLKYRSKLVNWALEVINWLEFKDGRNTSNSHFNGAASFSSIHPQASGSSVHSTHNFSDNNSTFLASLLAVVLPLRDQLNEEPYSGDSETQKPKHVARIVIMTSNSAVAKKLIYILSGVVPNVQFSSENVATAAPSKLSMTSMNGASDSKSSDSHQSSNMSQDPNHQSANYLEAAESTSYLNRIGSNSNFGDDEPKLATPIPIQTRSQREEPDSASLSVSSKSGWEVPTKSMASVSFNEPKSYTDDINVTAARQIPTSRPNNSTSIAYLSSSLNSSLSSSASNYSLSKLGSSFMDRWRGSLVGANKPSIPGYNFDSMDGALAHDVLSEKPLFVSAKSPSPAFEYDEPIWEDATTPSRSASPGRRHQKFSVADDKLLIKSSNGESLPSVNIDRCKSSIYLPNRGEEQSKKKNAALVRSKVAEIMSRKSCWVQQKHTLRVSSSSDTLTQKPQRNVVLKPNVAFVDAFRPEYILQSCPANPRLENQVMNAMKNDLLFHHNNCGKNQVTSTTVFISLRAREIKLIEMSVGAESTPLTPKGNFTPPTNVHVNKVSGSPITSYFSGVDGNKERKPMSSPAYRTTIKKVFTPFKNSGNKKSIGELDAKLEKLTEIVSLINNNSDSFESRENLDRMFYNSLDDILGA